MVRIYSLFPCILVDFFVVDHVVEINYFVLQRTYGRWWEEAPSKSLDYMPQNNGPIVSHDYIGKYVSFFFLKELHYAGIGNFCKQ